MSAGQGARADLTEFAPAKVNLTLSVRGRRADGYHDIDSLVAFAAIGDDLAFVPDGRLSLRVEGEFADAAGPSDGNLVLRAARALAGLVPGLKLGGFVLAKRLPVAAGLGGGSADAAAALRLLARHHGLAIDAAALMAAAAATGSDVPVCLGGGCRVMSGRGERLGPRLPAPKIAAVLVNPGVALATPTVFAALASAPARGPTMAFAAPRDGTSHAWLDAVALGGNDLEPPAISLAPIIAQAIGELAAMPGCALARMTGSGATVAGLFERGEAAGAAARLMARSRPGWWVRQTTLG